MIHNVTDKQITVSGFTVSCSGFHPIRLRILPDPPQIIATAMLFGRSNKLLCRIDRNSRVPVRNAGWEKQL